MFEVGMHEAKTTLSQLVARVHAGEDVIITRHGEPVARLVPASGPSSLGSVRGAWRGRVHMADDFDDLPDDIADAFGAR
jgi:prevent-host-death family protein